ncbi:MAG TPA: T9SS type A sorting domain-containing protein [Moheibacter sp.]|nr:T9SS type A sorting domain-containing protein [Moheibacter sp.]
MKKISLFLGLILYGFTLGQWTDDYAQNTLVADAPTGDIQSIGTNDGKTYVIFWDESDGYELRIQLLDADGNQLWGSNGILANDIADNGTWTATRSQAVDAEGNLYIAFTATNEGNGYINKISPEGEQLFGLSGISVPEGWDMKILPMEDGGVIAGWVGTGVGMLMRYDASGNEVWDAPLEVASPDSSNPFASIGELAGLSDGSFIAFIHAKGTSWGVNSLLWAQRYDADGVSVWDNPIQVSTQTLMSNRRYPLLQDGDTTYLGYYGSTGFRFDSFLQRINPDGTLPWGIDGSAFGTDDNFYEMETSIAFIPGTDHIWAAANITDSNQSIYGLSVQKFNKETGEPMLDFFGKTIFPVNADNWVHVGGMQLANQKPLILFSTGISDGTNPIQLGVVYLDEDGEFAWEEEYKMIATSNGNKGRYDFTQNVDGQSVAVWTEPREGISKAYAQNIIVEDETAGVSDLNTSNISVYPNPTSGMLNIDSKVSIQKIEIFSMTGQLLKKVEKTTTLNLSDLGKGVYVIRISPEKGTSLTKKIILK